MRPSKMWSLKIMLICLILQSVLLFISGILRIHEATQPKITAPPVTVSSAPVSTPQLILVPKQINSDWISHLDLRTPCEFTSDDLEAVTRFNLKGLGSTFFAQNNKINAIFLLAVAAQESGWGRSPLALNNDNLFGWRYKESYTTFHSQSYSIEYVGDKLRSNYLDAGLITVDQIGPVYCTESEWSSEITKIMVDMYNQLYERNGTMTYAIS